MLLKDKNLSDGFLFFLTPPHPPKEHVTFVKTFEDSLRPLRLLVLLRKNIKFKTFPF